MALVKDHLKIKNTVTSVILYLSDYITRNLRAFKTHICVEEHAHNRLSSSNILQEKGDILYLKISILGICSICSANGSWDACFR